MILVVCLSYTFHSLIVLSNSIELKLCGERGVGGDEKNDESTH